MKSKSGFTVVELLVVVAVLGILVGIVVLAYKNQQYKAADVSIANDLTNINVKLELVKIDSAEGYYPSDDPEELTTRGIRVEQKSYATAPSVRLNLAYCRDFSGPTSPISGLGYAKNYAVVAISVSGKKFVTGPGYPTKEVIPANAPNTGINTSDYDDKSCSAFGAGMERSYAGYDPDDRHPYNNDTIPWRKWVLKSGL